MPLACMVDLLVFCVSPIILGSLVTRGIELELANFVGHWRTFVPVAPAAHGQVMKQKVFFRCWLLKILVFLLFACWLSVVCGSVVSSF